MIICIFVYTLGLFSWSSARKHNDNLWKSHWKAAVSGGKVDNNVALEYFSGKENLYCFNTKSF
jgi:hypothetical protein